MSLRVSFRRALIPAAGLLFACAPGDGPSAPKDPGPGGGPGSNPGSGSQLTQRMWIDQAYGTAAAQKLDLFLPSTGSGPFKLIIWIHGGEWRSGSKTLADDAFQRRVLAQGFALASVEYRLSPVATWPAQIHDVKAAVRYLRANATRFALDSTRFGVWGASAGGHLAALLGTSGGVAALEGTVGTTTASSRVQAVVDWFGPTDFSRWDAQLIAAGCAAPGTVTQGLATSESSQLLGAAIGTVPALVAQANPITYVTPDDPPFLIFQGGADCTVPFGQSLILQGALGAAGVNASLTLIDGAGHGGTAFTNDTTVDRVIAFFTQALR